MMRNATIRHGSSFPRGSTLYPGGVNCRVFSKIATLLEVLLFNDVHEAPPAHVIRLDSRWHRTYHSWHGCVSGLKAGQLYGYQVSGPYEPARGHRFDPDKGLLDPYGPVAVPPHYSRRTAQQPGENTAVAMQSAVVAPQAYNWQGDAPLQRAFAHTVRYEMHVAGFTQHPSSGVASAPRGTNAGLIEKIPSGRTLG